MAKSKRRRLTDRLDEVCREVIRERDNNQCQHCGKKVEGSNSHPCHVVAKGNGASLRRFDLLNIFLGCMRCHKWWHDNPTESGKWFAKKFPAREAYLEIYRGGKPAKITTAEMEKLLEILKQKLADLKGKDV
jgi:5-methylcytosine-specific restriction endonuclease McrA